MAYLCLITPILLMLSFLESKSRTVYGYMIIGMTVAIIASQTNSLLLGLLDGNYFYTTANFTPLNEEIIKALPVLFFAYAVSDKREQLVSVGFAVGIGFALLENLTIMLQNIETSNILWVFCRGIGAGLMHGICTGSVAWGLNIMGKKKQMILPGLFAVLSFAVLYHSIFNILVQTPDKKYFGLCVPLLTYIPLVVIYIRQRRKKKTAN